MAELTIKIEKPEAGRIRVTVLDYSASDYNGEPHKAWEVETSDEWTKAALKSAIKATANHLVSYLSKTMTD